MSDYVQVVGCDTPSTAATGSCCLVADERRILFNCPEGAQRHFSEARLKISKTSHFLFTRISVATTMGLPGFIFTINDSHANICYFGGPQQELANVLGSTWKCFFGYRKMTAELADYSCPDSLQSRWITFQGGHMLPNGAEKKSVTEEPSSSAAIPQLSLGQTLFRSGTNATEIVAWYGGVAHPSPVQPHSAPVICYALVERSKVVFDAKKARALGVRPGPKYAMLKSGNDVVSDDDPSVTVKAQDVVLSQPTGAAVSLVLDTDSPSDLMAALQSWWSSNAAKAYRLKFVFHVTAAAVADSDTYKNAMSNERLEAAGIPAVGAVHVRCCSDMLTSAFPTAMVHRFHLAAIAPRFFPVCREACSDALGMWPYSQRYRLAHAPKTCEEPVSVRNPSMTSAVEMLSMDFRTRFVTPSDAAVFSATDHDARNVDAGSIAFLGTGSSVPSKYRNVSGILVALPSVGNSSDVVRLVLDCGEGTVGQLFSLYCLGEVGGGQHGASQSIRARDMKAFRSCLRSIELIFISHSHADHNLGLLLLLQEIHVSHLEVIGTQKRSGGVTLVAPADFVQFVMELRLVDFDVLRRDIGLVVDSFSTAGPMRSTCPVRLEKRQQEHHSSPVIDSNTGSPSLSLGDSATSSQENSFDHFRRWCQARAFHGDVFPVDHPAHAHGIVLQSNRGVNAEPFSVMYSGDCRPSPTLISRGRRFGPLSVLVHEATFDDELQQEAVFKKHSTTGEAIQVGKQCGAQHVVLTHFSQRYPKLPPPSAALTSESSSGPRVTFSFDYMMMPLAANYLLDLARLTPTFVALLAEYDSWEAGTSKRMREVE